MLDERACGRQSDADDERWHAKKADGFGGPGGEDGNAVVSVDWGGMRSSPDAAVCIEIWNV